MVNKENKLSWMMLFIPAYPLILYQGLSHQVSQSKYSVFIYLLIVLGAIAGIILEIRRKVALDRRREAVARGELEQVKIRPLPESSALSLPVRFQYLPGKRQWGFYLYLSTVFLLIFEIVFLVGAFSPGDPFRDLHTSMAITLPVLALALWLGTYFFRSTQWLIVAEEGLTKRTLLSKTTMRWQDARLFASHAPTSSNSSLSGNPVDVFELSSSSEIIHWTGSQHIVFGLYLRRIPHETYEQHMQALLATITAKTGLKCYDLSA